MIPYKIVLISFLTIAVAAQDIQPEAIPEQCTAICSDVVSIAQRCDAENTNNDATAELNCICRTPNAGTLFPSCEACFAAYYDGDETDTEGISGDENVVLDVVTRCNFTTTAFNTASASSILQSVASSFASASGSVITTTSGTEVLTTSIPAATQVPSQTAGAVTAQTPGVAVGLGIIGLAMGML